MKNLQRFFFSFFLLLLVYSCSTQKDRFFNREYHALNTKFNVLFNGKEALAIGNLILEENAEDDFSNILSTEPLFLLGEDVSASASIPSFALAEEKAVKAIQKHSININGNQKNRQIQEAYMLLGKARYYDRRFIPALESFNFILKDLNNQSVYYEAKLWREKTQMRMNNNALAIENLKPIAERIIPKAKLYPLYQATLAQAYLNIKEKDSARKFIQKAATAEKSPDLKSRYQFIAGQLLEDIEAKDSALKAYQKIVDLKRRAPRTLWMHAQLKKIEITSSRDSISPMRALTKLANVFENRPYVHLIYRQQGEYLLDKGEDSLSLIYYNKSLKSPGINLGTRVANYRDLADFYFENNNYVKAGKYLDSLLYSLPEEGQLKRKTTRERKSLDEVILFEEQIQKNDSILYLVGLDSLARVAYFETQIQAKKEKALAQIASEKKRLKLPFSKESNTAFYFYNERLRVAGKQAFLSQWGNRPNKDQWNRLTDESRAIVSGDTKDNSATTGFFKDSPEFYIGQIPTKERVIDSLKKVRNQAYLETGILYKESFDNSILATDRLEKLLSLNPNTNQKLNALYHLYKMNEEHSAPQALLYKNQIIEEHPESRFAKILSQPDSYQLDENQSPEELYEKLLDAFKTQAYEKVLDEGENLKIVFAGTPLASKLTYLMSLALARLDGEAGGRKALLKLIEDYPNAAEAEAAKTTIAQWDQRAKNKYEDGQRVFLNFKWVIVFPKTEPIPEDFLSLVRETIAENTQWKVSVDVYNRSQQFLVLHTFGDQPDRQQFISQWDKHPYFELMQNNFVVLSTEYEKIQRYKSWENK